MTETADAVVVGGGILGASTAYYLGKLGFGTIAFAREADGSVWVDWQISGCGPFVLLK